MTGGEGQSRRQSLRRFLERATGQKDDPTEATFLCGHDFLRMLTGEPALPRTKDEHNRPASRRLSGDIKPVLELAPEAAATADDGGEQGARIIEPDRRYHYRRPTCGRFEDLGGEANQSGGAVDDALVLKTNDGSTSRDKAAADQWGES